MNVIKNAKVYVRETGIVNTDILFDDKVIEIKKGIDQIADEITLPSDAIVLPGFIDTHIHGCNGFDTMDSDKSAVIGMSRYLPSEGTTSFLATTMTQDISKISLALKNVQTVMEGGLDNGARLLGVHLEGPFISSDYKGAQPQEYILDLDVDLLKKLQFENGEVIKIVTYAPEKDKTLQFVSALKSMGIIPSVGHSGAGYDDVKKGVINGLCRVTHTFNAQSPCSHKNFGVAGCAMLMDELDCELIADTIHVAVPTMKLLYKNKPQGKLVLITDSMRAKGLPDGVSELGGQTVIVKNGEARLENGSLAGSVLKMNVAVKNLVQSVGVDFETAVDCASYYPAKSIGIEDKVGSIAVNKSADFTVIDGDFNVLLTIKEGKVVYKK